MVRTPKAAEALRAGDRVEAARPVALTDQATAVTGSAGALACATPASSAATTARDATVGHARTARGNRSGDERGERYLTSHSGLRSPKALGKGLRALSLDEVVE
jgi:hypothetical protein